MGILQSLAGILVLFLIAYIASNNRKQIKWRTIIGAFGFQIAFAIFALYLPIGKTILLWLSNVVIAILDSTKQGTEFLLGGLASDKMFEVFGDQGFIVAFQVLPVIIFFSALASLLFHLGILQIFVKVIGGAIQKILGTSKAESMSASANIFLGVTEAPLVIRPYLLKLSKSEYFAVLVGGVASIAGSMLLAYAQFGVKIEYLLAASFMSAPAGLLFAKLLFPETESVEELDKALQVDSKEIKSANIIDAIASGAGVGLTLALNIGAMILAIVALVALFNAMLGGIGNLFGFSLSLDIIFGWILSPIAFLIGIEWSEAPFAGAILGQKLVFTEVIGYANLKPYLEGEILAATNQALSDKTQVILSFALCGFANIATIAIAVAGIGGLCPERKTELTSIAMKGLFAALLANLMNGAIAGLILG